MAEDDLTLEEIAAQTQAGLQSQDDAEALLGDITSGLNISFDDLLTGQAVVPALGSFFGGPESPQQALFDPRARRIGALQQPYTVNDVGRILTGMNRADLTALQEKMVLLGYMREADFGFRDASTVKGFEVLLGESNQEGINWSTLISSKVRAVEQGTLDPQGAGAADVEAPVYLAPDYDTLRQAVRQQFVSSLGRQPTRSEMQQFADRMLADYEAAAAVQGYDTGAGRIVEADPGTPTVDPMDSFAEAFEATYRPQIASLEEQNATNDALNATLGGL